jgi:23S rRNA pseudouridine2457 synthase
VEEFEYFILYKPYNVLNQFSKEHIDHITLADFIKVDKDVYPIGRLDKDSEGLLILSNDTSLNSILLSPVHGHKRTYLVQLDGEVTEAAIQKISSGVQIKLDSGMYLTKPCEVKKLFKEPLLPERNPPIRYRKNIPTSWASITISEGKNRQVRKMFASCGFPVLRLVRVQIEDLKIGKLLPGQSKKFSQKDIYSLLRIDLGVLKKNPKKNPEHLPQSTKSPKKPTDSSPKSKTTFKEFRRRASKKK